MNAIALGPVLISLPRLYAIGCALALLLASRYLLGLPRHQHGRWFNGLVVVWLVGARLGHVVMQFESYADAPLDALKFWQPGYHGLWGMAAALAWTAWTLRHRPLAMGGALALVVGSSTLWLVLVMLSPLGGQLPVGELPDITLEDIEGREVHLPALIQGDQRIIVNLWATWCPPCLREMPLLEQAAQREDVTVVIVNQGEDLLPIVRYLDEQQLEFGYALRDPRQQLMALFESPGLPTTLLFDAQGRAIEQHVGELTPAQLDSWLND
ncbi:TlpA disulfide reductase family protein [Vreelandella rituensis]|uniref:TlpA family protein disulfide reductase n=1 Tax=Vreelandella rituensis TaxID=2282306 RepID=A0A368U7F8_9GAMM|nr:TlpA disulfide reductase family protein [Halomonas rituensis]RCV93060.1 TlpA family protein disulfide reductase [Halomonas rituensis]